ncbi:MAG TPA: tetratricopeptide repeat protein [bacterium]|nr:tetratricopeptide repeat protein [bacterium]
MEENVKTGKGRTATVYLIALGLTLLARLPSLWVPWQYDDYHHIADNPGVMRLANVPRLFVDSKLFSSQVINEGMYRPLLMTTHALTYAVFGDNPLGAHLVNLMLHLINTALVLSLLRRWTGRDGAALMGALLWSLFAVQAETVAYASARSTLLASVFMLAALRVTDNGMGAWKQAALAALFFVLALLVKELAFVLPLLVLARDLTLGRARGMDMARRWPVYALTLALMPAYLAARVLLFSSALGAPYMSRFTYLVTQAKVFFLYIGWTLFPLNLTPKPDITTAPGLSSPAALGCALGVAGLLVLAIILHRRAPRFSFGVSWFALGLAPTSTIAPLYLIASAERIYLPLLGLVVVGAAAFESLFRNAPGREKIAAGLCAVVLGLNVVLGLQVQNLWLSTTGLMRQLVRMAPEQSNAWVWLGIMEMYDNRLEPARKHLLKAMRLNPDDPLALDSYARLKLLMEPNETAREAFEAVLRDPNSQVFSRINALIRLAAFDIDEGRLDQAEHRARIVLKNQPDNFEAYMILGLAAQKRGDPEAAKAFFRRALEIMPDYPEVQTKLGIIASREGDHAAARKLLTAVTSSDKPLPEACVNLGLLELREDRPEEARALFEQAIAIDPNDALGYVGMGWYFAVRGEVDKAQENFEQAAAKNPDNTDAREGLTWLYLGRLERGDLAGRDREWWLAQAGEQLRWLQARGLDPELIAQWEKLSGRRLE